MEYKINKMILNSQNLLSPTLKSAIFLRKIHRDNPKDTMADLGIY